MTALWMARLHGRLRCEFGQAWCWRWGQERNWAVAGVRKRGCCCTRFWLRGWLCLRVPLCFVKTKKCFCVFKTCFCFFGFLLPLPPPLFFLFPSLFLEREKELERERERESLLEKYRESGVFIGFSLIGKKVWWASCLLQLQLQLQQSKQKGG